MDIKLSKDIYHRRFCQNFQHKPRYQMRSDSGVWYKLTPYGQILVKIPILSPTIENFG